MSRLGTALWLACAACGRIGFADEGGDGSITSSSPAAAYANEVITDAPVAYFHLDEAGGSIAASATGSITGQYEGTFGFGTTGAMAGSRAVRFDGATTRINFGDQFRFTGTVPYSFELWMRPTALASTRFLIDRQSTATPIEGYSIYMGDGFLLQSRTVAGTETSYVSGTPPVIGTWMYVVATWDGAIPRFYSNGTLIGENPGGASTIGGGAGTFVIGDVTGGQFYKLEGDLDEVAIYDHALTPQRIAAHYAAAK